MIDKVKKKIVRVSEKTMIGIGLKTMWMIILMISMGSGGYFTIKSDIKLVKQRIEKIDKKVEDHIKKYNITNIEVVQIKQILKSVDKKLDENSDDLKYLIRKTDKKDVRN